MAKFHLDRIKKKYGWTGENYSELMSKIIASNSENIQRATARISKKSFEKENKKITKKEKRFVLPDVTEALPKRSVYLRKGAEKGTLLTDNIRDRLTKDLRETLTQPGYISARGVTAGSLKNKIVDDFEKKITATFQGYTKKDPRYGVPSNIHNIAVTEVRSAVDNMKHDYISKVIEKDPAVIVMKKWKHNKKLSKVQPRETHEILGRQRSIPFDKNFVIPVSGVQCPYPHAPGMPADEVIGCHCECIYMVRKK